MIVVWDPKAPAVREEVLFMAETTRMRKGTVPPYICHVVSHADAGMIGVFVVA